MSRTPTYASVVRTLLDRVLSWWVARASSHPQLVIASTGETGVTAEYSPSQALSTLARFPWVWVCASAVAWDLAGQPLVAVRREGRRRRIVDDQALSLLQRPSPSMPGTLFLAQLMLDRQLAGNAYVWVPGLGAWRAGLAPYPTLALRMHPEHVELRSGAFGMISAFVYTDTSTQARQTHTIPAEDVIYVRGPSWRDTALSVLGESVIRCLHEDLVTELAARKLVAQQAEKGRPDVFFSADGNVNKSIIDEILGRWVEATRNGLGAMVVGNGVTATPVSWSPKEFPFGERSDKLRDTILALFEVTPSRAGIAAANYGTDRQQARTYWSSLQRKSAEWSDAFSMLCAPGTRIEVDFSAVEALQVSYSERLARVQAWVAMGADPAEAAAYEGFDEAPIGAGAGTGSAGASTAPRTDSEDGYQGTRRALELALGVYLRAAGARYAAAAGTELGLLARSEAAILRSVLEGAGVARAAAWAEELAGITDEAVRSAGDIPLDELRAFSPDRARRIAITLDSLREAA